MPRFDLVSAALRHVRDAEHLLEAGPNRSVEQALHLAGFGPECARKACVDEALTDVALGHDIRTADDLVLEVLIALDPSASRYDLGGHSSALPLRAAWRVDCRYMATGTANEQHVVALVKEARAFVDARVAELWCDGALSSGDLR